jgi:hypothetical protein
VPGPSLVESLFQPRNAFRGLHEQVWIVYAGFVQSLPMWLQILCYLAVPVLAFFAYRGWAKTKHADWRGKMGLASILAVSANWLFGILLLVFHFINPRWWSFLNDAWLSGLILSALAAALFALSLKGAARFYGVAAGLLMAAFWLLGIQV